MVTFRQQHNANAIVAMLKCEVMAVAGRVCHVCNREHTWRCIEVAHAALTEPEPCIRLGHSVR